MSPLAQFVAYFLAVSAVTALVHCMIQEGRPGKILRQAFHFYFLIVAGIGIFSVLVFFLEMGFIRRP